MPKTATGFLLGVLFACTLTVAAAAPSHRIELLGYSFDPLADHEPAVPAGTGAGRQPRALLQLAEALGATWRVAIGRRLSDASRGTRLSGPLGRQGSSMTAKRAEIAARGLCTGWVRSRRWKIAPQPSGRTTVLDVFHDADLAAVNPRLPPSRVVG
jgi:hypothetical protein